MKAITLFLVLCLSFLSFGQFPNPYSPPRLYNDFSVVPFLNSTEASELESILESFEKTTSNEIAVIVVDDLDGMEPSSYAFEIGEKWGVGKEKEDNGIVILIKPTEKNGGRQVFIAVGRGLEGAIPDLTANDIVQNEILPAFKRDERLKGLKNALTVLTKLAKGEINHANYGKSDGSDWIGGLFALLFIIVIVILVVRKGGRGGRGGRGGSGGFTIGDAIVFTSILRGFGGGSSGSSSGSSGGGFGGFGGGSFGGGGAGGSW